MAVTHDNQWLSMLEKVRRPAPLSIHNLIEPLG